MLIRCTLAVYSAPYVDNSVGVVAGRMTDADGVEVWYTLAACCPGIGDAADAADGCGCCAIGETAVVLL